MDEGPFVIYVVCFVGRLYVRLFRRHMVECRRAVVLPRETCSRGQCGRKPSIPAAPRVTGLNGCWSDAFHIAFSAPQLRRGCTGPAVVALFIFRSTYTSLSLPSTVRRLSGCFRVVFTNDVCTAGVRCPLRGGRAVRHPLELSPVHPRALSRITLRAGFPSGIDECMPCELFSRAIEEQKENGTEHGAP
ncbi:hypothetical protein BD413DRAFT_512715 [Trametes elegans]|nr:hypothetical protein BD413DRAFT_512715 [Trametes elegans]